MQITADRSRMSNIVQVNLTFVINVLLESSIHFPKFSAVLATKMLLVLHKMVAFLSVTIAESVRAFAATI